MEKQEPALDRLRQLLKAIDHVEELTRVPISFAVRGRQAFPGLGMDLWFANTPTECDGCTGCLACQGCTGCAGTASAQSAALRRSMIRALDTAPAGP